MTLLCSLSKIGSGSFLCRAILPIIVCKAH